MPSAKEGEDGAEWVDGRCPHIPELESDYFGVLVGAATAAASTSEKSSCFTAIICTAKQPAVVSEVQ